MKPLYFLIFFWPLIVSFKMHEGNLNLTDVTITSTALPKRDKAKRSTSLTCVPISLKKSKYNICINISSKINNLFSKLDTKITIPNSMNSSDLDFEFAKGYVQNYENESYVDGFIEDGSFYGRIIINNTIYYAEKLTNFPKIMKEYNVKSLNYGAITFSTNIRIDNIKILFKQMPMVTQENRKLNICPLVIVIDESFLKKIANNSVKLATSIIVSSFDRVHTIFRSTDFTGDGIPENIGFRIKEIIIHPAGYILKYKNHEIDAFSHLAKFLAFPKLEGVCLGIAFTAQQFKDQVIGLTYQATTNMVGGICSSGFAVHYNAIVITYMQNNFKNPQVTNDICLGHEIGHSFGSDHDTRNCSGHIMAATTTYSLPTTSFSFSKCSRDQMNKIYPFKNYCFEEDRTPFCGNGIVEENEECDCGSIYNCVFRDHCCLQISYANICKVSAFYNCHPSQGLCCTSSCTIRNIKHLGLSCSKFQRKCNKQQSYCGIDGKCVENTCHSNECVRIGLNECKCPENNDEYFCFTCCKYQGKCLSARNASRLVISAENNIINNFKRSNISKTKTVFDVVEQFCSNGACVPVLFKRFPAGEYCLVNGNLGICEANFVCTARIIKYDMLPYRGSFVKNIAPTLRISRKFIIILVAIKFIIS